MVIPMEPRNDRNQPFSPRGTRRGRRRATRWMVTCALLCALAVVTLGMGALVELFDLTAAAVAAVVLLPILLCYGVRYAVLSYAVTAVLGVILMPHSLGSWMFLALTGYYPLIKKRLDRLPRILAWAAKLSVVGVVLFAYLGLFYLLVMGGNGSFVDTLILGIGEGEGGAIVAWAAVGLMVFTYVLFDILIDRLLVLYYLRWQKRVEKWMGK